MQEGGLGKVLRCKAFFVNAFNRFNMLSASLLGCGCLDRCSGPAGEMTHTPVPQERATSHCLVLKDLQCEKTGKLVKPYFTKEMKRAFEVACQARFPCENTCEKEYTAPCPEGWVTRGKSCNAPEGSSACGINMVSFALMSLAEKKNFERGTGVSPVLKVHRAERQQAPRAALAFHGLQTGWNVIPAPGKTLQQMLMEGNWLNIVSYRTAARSFVVAGPASSLSSCTSHFAAFLSDEDNCARTEAGKAEQREIGKHGPVHDRTGEVWPRRSKSILPFTRIVGAEKKKEVPKKLPAVEQRIIQESEAQALTEDITGVWLSDFTSSVIGKVFAVSTLTQSLMPLCALFRLFYMSQKRQFLNAT
ncbi:cpw-wpc domain-containing protein [Cyclospora cayetanensis]|uniref:Cpw-wpc domain-containing protein n=1 Tax=Cyclospora cayetanensis TaxID=88456 RepID=A0A1D3CVD2_9EIME|nr:cpw-wpc domain-containing protein [Cyclospora cayetanensis]